MQFSKLNFWCILIFFGFQCYHSYGQQPMPKSLKKAFHYTLKKNHEKAEHFFLKTIHKYPQQPEYYIYLAQHYQRLKKFDNEKTIYEKAIQTLPQHRSLFGLPYSEALFHNQEYKKAQQQLAEWERQQSVPNPIASQKLKENIQFALSHQNRKLTADPENLGTRINTVYDDYFPSITANDSLLVFTRRNKGIDEDFFWAHRDSCGGWFMAQDMGSPPNSPQQEGAQMLSTDQRYLFFMRCENATYNGWQEGGCDLYFSYSENNGWSEPLPFGGMINTTAYEGTPSLSSDNKIMFFSSNRPGGYGGLDIWMTVFEDGLWQPPVNLGPTINTDGDETAPWIAADNKTLYFSSNGHAGYGGMDIFKAIKQSDSTWSSPLNLGQPLNSSSNEIGFCVSIDGEKAYFASDRAGGMGGMDLYEIPIELESQPDPFALIYGKVKDSLSQEKITYAQIEWYDLESQKKIHHFQSNRGDGSYMASLPIHKNLLLKVYRTGFLDYGDTIYFDKKYQYPPDTFNITLLPSHYSPPMKDTMILRYFFEKNQTTFSDSIIEKISNHLKPFLSKKYTAIFINGFTDDSGTPPINEQISYSRARLFAKILFNLGAEERKIHTQGWADASPLYPNDTEENRMKNRRVEIIFRLEE